MSCKKQRTVPCASCPFRKTTPPGELGGSPTPTYIGQANGPFFLPCHEAEGYRPDNDMTREQCAGAAIFRANCNVSQRPPLLALPPSTDHVFGSFVEFIAHHEQMSPSLVAAGLRIYTPDEMTRHEFAVAVAKNGITLVPKGGE